MTRVRLPALRHMIKIYHKNIKENRLKILNKFKVGSWVYAENPSEEELKYLSKSFHLEKGLLKDALDPNEVPRMEVEKSTTYIFTRIPYSESGKVSTMPVLVALGKDFLITVSQGPLPLLEKFIKGEVDFYTTQKTKLFLQIFSEINASYNVFLNNINRRVRAMSIKLEKISNKDIVQFVTFEGNINDFLGALVPTHTILKNILSGKFLKLYEKDEDLTEDLFLANGQFIESCRTILKTIVNVREAYSTIITNNLNRVIKLLTALTIILTVPTIIASFYGMNVRLPFADNPLAFFGILGVAVLISVFLLAIFVKNRWL